MARDSSAPCSGGQRSRGSPTRRRLVSSLCQTLYFRPSGDGVVAANIWLENIVLSLAIIHYPHPTLRHESKPLRRVDAELKQMVAEMFDLMYEHDGIGLAANQVDLPYRLFVVNVSGDPDQPEHEKVYINPVLSAGKGQESGTEGCLSIPGVNAPVVRSATIKIQAYDLVGNEINEELSGMDARVVQHETDHLDGRLFIDRLPPTVYSDIEPALHEFLLSYDSQLESGEVPNEEAVKQRLAELETKRT